jgi:colanic acid biosynthesis glycosyl transferase WcaI
VYWPDSTGNGPLLTDLSRWLVSRGHQVTVVCGFPHYGRDEVPQEYRGKWWLTEQEQGVRILRVRNYASQNVGRLHKLLGYLLFTVMVVFRGLRTPKMDVILAPSPPLSVGLSAWFLGKLKRAPFVYNVQDLFPEAYVELGALKSPWAIRFFKFLARFVYSRASRVVCVMESLSRAVAGYGIDAKKIVTIPNWADAAEISPRRRDSDFAREHGLNGQFVVQYSGNLGMSQRLDLVLECARQMADENVHFLLIGSGAQKRKLAAAIEEGELRNVTLLDTQPRERLAEVLGSCDVALVPLTAGMSRTSFPSKIYTIMASGRPMIAALDSGSDPQKFVEECGCGIVIDPDDSGQMLAAIRTLKRDAKKALQMGRQGRLELEQRNLREKSLAAYEQVLEEAVAGN